MTFWGIVLSSISRKTEIFSNTSAGTWTLARRHAPIYVTGSFHEVRRKSNSAQDGLKLSCGHIYTSICVYKEEHVKSKLGHGGTWSAAWGFLPLPPAPSCPTPAAATKGYRPVLPAASTQQPVSSHFALIPARENSARVSEILLFTIYCYFFFFQTA